MRQRQRQKTEAWPISQRIQLKKFQRQNAHNQNKSTRGFCVSAYKIERSRALTKTTKSTKPRKPTKPTKPSSDLRQGSSFVVVVVAVFVFV